MAERGDAVTKRLQDCVILQCVEIMESESSFDARLELPKSIAKGDDVCALRYIKLHDEKVAK